MKAFNFLILLKSSIKVDNFNPPSTKGNPSEMKGFFIYMEYVVYILYSESKKRNYTGYTSDLIRRFKSHNELGDGSTKHYRPWIVVHVEFFETKIEALKREKYYKSGRGPAKKNEIIRDYLTRWIHTLP